MLGDINLRDMRPNMKIWEGYIKISKIQRVFVQKTLVYFIEPHIYFFPKNQESTSPQNPKSFLSYAKPLHEELVGYEC